MLEILTIAGLSATAAIVCFFCAMVGSGSGLILVPMMIFAGLTPVQAIAVHKFEALWTVASGWRYWRNKQVHMLDFPWYLIIGCFGTFFGAAYIHFIPSMVLQIIVGVAIIAVALLINISDKIKPSGHITLWKRVFLVLAMFVFGIYEGTFGSGNGFFIAALFFRVIGSDELKTVGMITVLAAFWNIVATATHFSYGSLLWEYALPIGGSAIVGAWFGAGKAMSVSKKTICRVIFSVSLIGGSLMLFQALWELY